MFLACLGDALVVGFCLVDGLFVCFEEWVGFRCSGRLALWIGGRDRHDNDVFGLEVLDTLVGE
jgi:hypothetical protein